MRVLYSAPFDAESAPPQLGTEQVNCGPGWTDAQGSDGRWVSLAATPGRYDLGALLAKLGPAQKPDVFVCCIDGRGTNLPQNIARFTGPKILVITGTAHAANPILGPLQYLMSQPFTRVVLTDRRHHAAFYRVAGVRSLFWFPGLTGQCGDDKVDAPSASQAPLDPEHRRALFSALAVDGVPPAEFTCATAEEARALLPGGAAALVANARFFEALEAVHDECETVRVALHEVAPHVAALCELLPRVETVPAASVDRADFIVMSSAAEVPAVTSSRLWCADANPAQAHTLAARLASLGYACTAPDAGLFRRKLGRAGSDERRHIALYTDDPAMGGVAQCNHAFLRGLVDAGYRVTCIQARHENPLVAERRSLGIAHRWIPFDTLKEFSRTVTEFGPLEDVICEDTPDLVIFSDCCPVSNLAARRLAMRYGVPYLVIVGFAAEYLARDFGQLLPELKRQHAAARAVVAVSEENLGLLRSKFGTPVANSVVIPNGRPERFFADRDPAIRAKLRAELRIPESAMLCLTTARLQPVKGFVHQLRAIKLLQDKGVALPYYVWAGEGEQRAELERAIAEHGWQEHVRLIGYRWNVAEWYDAADAFILTSHLEGMPLSVMEAMAKGLPVAATAVSGIPEELGETGALLADPNVAPDKTARDLARTLTAWAADPLLRARVGAACRERARRLFREQTMVERTLALVARHAGDALAATAPTDLPEPALSSHER